jgi:hypothetical protein
MSGLPLVVFRLGLETTMLQISNKKRALTMDRYLSALFRANSNLTSQDKSIKVIITQVQDSTDLQLRLLANKLDQTAV